MIRMGYRNTLLAGMVLLLSSCSGEDPRMEQHPLPEMEFVYPESIEEVDSLLAILPRGQDLEELHSLSRAFHARYVFSRECSDLDSALSYGELAVTLSEGGMRYDVTNPESMKDIRKVIICAHAGRREFERAFNKLRRTYRIHPGIDILPDEAIRMMAEAEDSLSADGYRYLSFAHSIRADMMEDDRDREDALDTAARGLEKFPQDPRLNCRKGMALHAMGRDGAEHCFRRALELDPLDHDFRQVFDR